jgi:hypothetical protein
LQRGGRKKKAKIGTVEDEEKKLEDGKEEDSKEEKKASVSSSVDPSPSTSGTQGWNWQSCL